MKRFLIILGVTVIVLSVLCGLYIYNSSPLVKQEDIQETLNRQLVKAISSKDKIKIEELIALGAKTSPLFLAIILNQKDKVEELLKGQKPHIEIIKYGELTYTISGIYYYEMRGKSPTYSTERISISNLYIAVLYDRVEIAKLLLKYGADVNEGYVESSGHSGPIVSGGNTNRITPLTEAACSGHKEMTQLLLENGANVNYEDLYGYRVLDCVEDKDIKQLLIKYGAKEGSHKDHIERYD